MNILTIIYEYLLKKLLTELKEGTFFGLQGKVGIAIDYPRNISIKICVAPVLGMHLTKGDEYNMMRYYRYGLLQTILPEINISYRF